MAALMKQMAVGGVRKRWVLLVPALCAGAVLVFVVWSMQHRKVLPLAAPVPATTAEDLLRLQDRAQGPMPEVVYRRGDKARVAARAVAQWPDGTWKELAEDSVIDVVSMRVINGWNWVRGRVQGANRHVLLEMRASFLEPYQPVLLGEAVELSQVRLIKRERGGRHATAVTATLRNISKDDITRVVIVCLFRDENDRAVDAQQVSGLLLPPLEMVRFKTGVTTKPFHNIVLEITHATPDGLRGYLPTVVIQRSSLD